MSASVYTIRVPGAYKHNAFWMFRVSLGGVFRVLTLLKIWLFTLSPGSDLVRELSVVERLVQRFVCVLLDVLPTVVFCFFFWRRKALQDKAMQRQTSTNQRDAPGQDTGRSQGHLSSYFQPLF